MPAPPSSKQQESIKSPANAKSTGGYTSSQFDSNRTSPSRSDVNTTRDTSKLSGNNNNFGGIDTGKKSSLVSGPGKSDRENVTTLNKRDAVRAIGGVPAGVNRPAASSIPTAAELNSLISALGKTDRRNTTILNRDPTGPMPQRPAVSPPSASPVMDPLIMDRLAKAAAPAGMFDIRKDQDLTRAIMGEEAPIYSSPTNYAEVMGIMSDPTAGQTFPAQPKQFADSIPAERPMPMAGPSFGRGGSMGLQPQNINEPLDLMPDSQLQRDMDLANPDAKPTIDLFKPKPDGMAGLLDSMFNGIGNFASKTPLGAFIKNLTQRDGTAATANRPTRMGGGSGNDNRHNGDLQQLLDDPEFLQWLRARKKKQPKTPETAVTT